MWYIGPMSTIAARLAAKTRRARNGCLIFTGGTNRAGYGNIYTHSIGRRTFVTGAHRAAYEIAFGPIPEGKHVLHRCDNPSCVEPSHLFIGTPADNMQDKSAKGRALPGPVSRRDWWTPERRQQHSADRKRYKARLRADAAAAAGYPADWLRCPTCAEWKAPDSFGRNKARDTGLQGHCKACKNAADDARRPRKTDRRCSIYRSDKIHF